MKIGLTWWAPSAGGSRQAVRGNHRALSAAGHDVTLRTLQDHRQLESEARRGRYDAVVMPYLHYPGDLSAYADTHLHLQIGGLPASPQPDLTMRSIEAADTVSVLDPSILREFAFDAAAAPAEFSVIPNPPNRELFTRQDATASGEYVFVAKLGGSQRGESDIGAVARAAPNERFAARYTGDRLPSLPPNVTLYPPVPLTAMPNQYAQSRIVLNPSAEDVLPNTAFEAFLSGRPYIAREAALGDIQSLPADVLDPSAFGLPCAAWLDRFGDAVGAGEHVVTGDSPAALAAAVGDIMSNDQHWAAIVAAADEYLDAWVGWDWQAKGETLTACIEDGPRAV